MPKSRATLNCLARKEARLEAEFLQAKKREAGRLVAGDPKRIVRLYESYPNYETKVVRAPLLHPGLLEGRQLSHDNYMDSRNYWDFVFSLAGEILLEEAAQLSLSDFVDPNLGSM